LDNLETATTSTEQPKGLSDEEVAVSGDIGDNLDDFLGLDG